jgi:PAS domain S-box-containing protein
MEQGSLFVDAVLHASTPADFLGSVIQASTEYAIIATDLHGVILLWNEGARRIYGYAADEVIGTSVDLLHAPEDLALGLPAKMRAVTLAQGRWEGIIAQITKDQRRMTTRVMMTRRLDAPGEPVGFLLMSQDATREYHLRIRQERTPLLALNALGTSAEDLLEFVIALLQTSPEYAIIGLDPVGTIILWNAGAQRLYGYEPQAVIQRANVAILHRDADGRAALPGRMLHKARTGGVWAGDVVHVTQQGTVFHARVVITPRYDAERTLCGYLAISCDFNHNNLADFLRHILAVGVFNDNVAVSATLSKAP